MLSAPPPEAHPTHSVGTDMDTADAEIEPDPPVQIQSQQDVGVQVVQAERMQGMNYFIFTLSPSLL